MVIVLLLPTLQTLVMDRLSSTHLGIIQMEIIRGYERCIQTFHCLLIFAFCWSSFWNVFFFFFFSSVVQGWLSTELQAWSWSGTQRSVERQHSGNAILRKPFYNDCDWLTCTTLKILNSRMHLPQFTLVLFFFISGIFSLQSK